jgi:hypothetical protein
MDQLLQTNALMLENRLIHNRTPSGSRRQQPKVSIRFDFKHCKSLKNIALDKVYLLVKHNNTLVYRVEGKSYVLPYLPKSTNEPYHPLLTKLGIESKHKNDEIIHLINKVFGKSYNQKGVYTPVALDKRYGVRPAHYSRGTNTEISIPCQLQTTLEVKSTLFQSFRKYLR